jgi:protein TonB
MRGSNQPRVGMVDVGGDHNGHVADLRDAVVRLPEREVAAVPAPPIRAGNVVPFARVRREAAPTQQGSDIPFKPAERPAPLLTDRQRNLFVAFLAGSLVCHGSLYFLLNREPTPMASLGIEAISVELLLGDNVAPAPRPGPSVPDNTPADDPEPIQTNTQTATDAPEEVREARPVEEARPVTVEVRPGQPKTVTATEVPEVRAEEKPQTAVLQVQEMQAPRLPELAVAPEVPQAPKLADLEKPQPVRTETAPEPQPKRAKADTREPKRKTDRGPKRKQELPGPVGRTASNTREGTGPRSALTGGVGIGRSQANSNYPGIVRAHLARYQRHDHSAQGSAMVSFGLDAGGRVTHVSVARGSGNASLDQEAQAMVRRASPFPPPPAGAPRSFTVPVRFTM